MPTFIKLRNCYYNVNYIKSINLLYKNITKEEDDTTEFMYLKFNTKKDIVVGKRYYYKVIIANTQALDDFDNWDKSILIFEDNNKEDYTKLKNFLNETNF